MVLGPPYSDICCPWKKVFPATHLCLEVKLMLMGYFQFQPPISWEQVHTAVQPIVFTHMMPSHDDCTLNFCNQEVSFFSFT